jgi:hypothetical protein
MWRLAGSVAQLIVEDEGPGVLLSRLSDPYWFQAFGCVLGFDWHSSGLTTVTCGALGEAYRRMGRSLGIHVAGGKGGVSRRTPTQITDVASQHNLQGDSLVYASRMSAKVDSAAVQDGYQVYTHHFFFTEDNDWCVIQQGMNDANGYARRYHWLGQVIDSFVDEPHAAVAAARSDEGVTLNMVASGAAESRQRSTELTTINPDKLMAEIGHGPTLFMPTHHQVLASDINPARLSRIVRMLHERQPGDYESLLGVAGVGPSTVRSLALLAELIYGTPQCREDITRQWSPRDPATFSYAHGGKDGHPFPVDRAGYDRSIAILEKAVRRAQLDPAGKDRALYRLSGIAQQQVPSRLPNHER